MTQQPVELLSRGYEAFAPGETDTVRTLLAPDIVVEVHTERPDMGSEVYHGYDGFLSNFSELTDVFDDLEVEPGAIEEHGNRALVACRVTGRGKGSGVAIEAKIFHVWTIRDQKAIRLEIYRDGDQARRAFRREA